MKRKRKTPRRKKQHQAVGSAMLMDRRQSPARRAIDAQYCRVRVWDNGDKTACGWSLPCSVHG